MIRSEYRLLAALVLSLAGHLLPFVAERLIPSLLPPKSTSTAAMLKAELRPPAIAAVDEAPPLHLPEPAKATAATPQTQRSPGAERPTRKHWTQAVQEQLRQLDAAGLFYPAEAIAQGLEGEADVLLVIDPSGQVVATRLEASSGHPSLDAAALRAARALRSLPADAPRETVLPIRFRLK